MTRSSLAVFVSLLFGTASLVACGDHVPPVIELRPAGEPARTPGMTVTGTATLEVSPDCADVSMTVSADAPSPGAAARAVHAKEAAVIAALEALGTERADIKLSLLTMNPIYDREPAGMYPELHVHTYRAEISVTVTTRHFDKLGDLMDASSAAGAMQMTTAFRRSDLPELKKKVRDMALAAARAKARQITDALDIKLGRIVSVAETQGGGGYSYAPQVANNMELRVASGPAIGGALQSLTLDITIGYELATAI